MALETEELLGKIAGMLNVVQVERGDCGGAYFSSAVFDKSKGKTEIHSPCPFCGSRNIHVPAPK